MICHCLDEDDIVVIMAIGLILVVCVLAWFNRPRR